MKQNSKISCFCGAMLSRLSIHISSCESFLLFQSTGSNNDGLSDVIPSLYSNVRQFLSKNRTSLGTFLDCTLVFFTIDSLQKKGIKDFIRLSIGDSHNSRKVTKEKIFSLFDPYLPTLTLRRPGLYPRKEKDDISYYCVSQNASIPC